MSSSEESSVKVSLSEEEMAILKKMAEKRGVKIDEFLNQLLSKFCSY